MSHKRKRTVPLDGLEMECGADAQPKTQNINLVSNQLPTIRAEPDIDIPAENPLETCHDGKVDIPESCCLGALSLGYAAEKNQVPWSISDDVDNSKTGVEMYPSLTIFAEPRLNPKARHLCDNLRDCSILGTKLNGWLKLTVPEFCKWLFQLGLVRRAQNCPLHQSPLQLVQNNSKEPDNLGLVWYGDCCKKSRMVSIFYGSIFESSIMMPSVILKLIYHWACQTNPSTVLQMLPVNAECLRNFYSIIRGVCVWSMNKKCDLFGGINKRVEVGRCRFRTKEGDRRVVGILDCDSKRVQLRLAKGGSYTCPKIAQFLTDNIKPNSIICCGHWAGFRRIFQDFQIDEDYSSNMAISEYIRETLDKFTKVGSPISAVLLQQLMDELAWREHWGPSPMSSFYSMIEHIAVFTNQNYEGGFARRLIEIAADPFPRKSSLSALINEVMGIMRERSAEPEAGISAPVSKTQKTQAETTLQPSVDMAIVPPPVVAKEAKHFSIPTMNLPKSIKRKPTVHGDASERENGTILESPTTSVGSQCFEAYPTGAHPVPNPILDKILMPPPASTALVLLRKTPQGISYFSNPGREHSQVTGSHVQTGGSMIPETRNSVSTLTEDPETEDKKVIVEKLESSPTQTENVMPVESILESPTTTVINRRKRSLELTIRRLTEIATDSLQRKFSTHTTTPSNESKGIKRVRPAEPEAGSIAPKLSKDIRLVAPAKTTPEPSFDRTIVPPPVVYKKRKSGQTKYEESLSDPVQCNFCSHEAISEEAAIEHYNVIHVPIFFSPSIPNSKIMYCICGYRSNGNDMATHLMDSEDTMRSTNFSYDSLSSQPSP